MSRAGTNCCLLTGIRAGAEAIQKCWEAGERAVVMSLAQITQCNVPWLSLERMLFLSQAEEHFLSWLSLGHPCGNLPPDLGLQLHSFIAHWKDPKLPSQCQWGARQACASLVMATVIPSVPDVFQQWSVWGCMYLYVCIYIYIHTHTDTNILNKTREEENPKSGAVDQESDNSPQLGGKSPHDLWWRKPYDLSYQVFQPDLPCSQTYKISA